METRTFQLPANHRATMMIVYPKLREEERRVFLRQTGADLSVDTYGSPRAARNAALRRMRRWREQGWAEIGLEQPRRHDYNGRLAMQLISWEQDGDTYNQTSRLRMRCYFDDIDQVPSPGTVVVTGRDVPPLPGMRGVFVVSTAEITMDGDRNSRPTVELELQATQGDVQEIMRDRDRLEELLARDYGEAPDWGDVWDLLDFLPAGQRQGAMGQIQQRHRDSENQAARTRRITGIAQRQQAKVDAEQLDLARAVLAKVGEIRHELNFGDKPRKIDLGDDE